MATVAGTIYLNGCNYQLQYDILSQSVQNNTTTIRMYGVLNVTNNYISWSSGTASVHTASTGIGTYYSKGSYTLITADFTFTHNSNGDLTIAPGYSLITTFVSGSSTAQIVLPHINRVARTDSVTGNDVEGTFKVNYTKYVNNYTYKVRISIPNVVMLERIDYNTSGEGFTLSQATLTDIFTRTKSDTSNIIQLGFAVETYDGSTKLSDGNEVIITGRIVNANPIFSNFEFEEVNSTVKTLTGSTTNNVINVNGYSNIKATISTTNKATAQKGADMVKYRFVIGDKSTDITYSSSASVNGTITGVVGGTYNVYAIDTRNNSTLVTKQATRVINYNAVSINKQTSKIVRNDNEVGVNAILTLKGTFWNGNFGATNNAIQSVTYRFKKTDSSTWIEGTTIIRPTINGDNFSFEGLIASDNQDTTWDLDASYNIQITIQDKLTSYTADFILNSAIPTLSLDKNGIGVMCAYNRNIGGLLQVGGKVIDGYDNYSTSEERIGTWINDKPLYRKVINIGSLPNNTTGNYAHGITNLDNIISISASWYDTSDNRWYSPIRFDSSTIHCVFFVNNTNVQCEAIGTNWSTRTNNCKVIIEYTKTTD